MSLSEIWAAVIALAIQQARQIEDEQEALKVQSLYKSWHMQIGKELTASEYIQHEGKLYKVLQTHRAQEIWIPGQGTEALYALIVKDATGEIDDAIPYEPNMEIFKGKYYTQYDILYVCTRDSQAPIYYNLADIVGLYVDVVLPKEDVIEDGSVEAPIHYNIGMTLVKDLFYIYNGVLYQCILNTVNPVYHDLSNLVGLYVLVANDNLS